MIYADAGVIIRLIEGAAKVRNPIGARLEEIRSQQPLILTSRLSRLERRCKPLRTHKGGQNYLSLGFNLHFVLTDVNPIAYAPTSNAVTGQDGIRPIASGP
jgi:hypothetical protein